MSNMFLLYQFWVCISRIILSNMALVKNNAAVGADIANSIVDMSRCRTKNTTIQSPQLPSHASRVVCVGGSVIDTVAKSSAEMIIGTSNQGKIHLSHGGVGRNVAEVLGRLGSKPLLYTAIGDDDGGKSILSHLQKECGVITTTESVNVARGYNTAQYLALLDHDSDLVGGVADMEALSQIPIPAVEDLRGVDYLVLDSNGPVDVVTRAAKNGVEAGCHVCFEPTSVPKAQMLSNSAEFVECLSYVFPNNDELLAMAEALNDGKISLGGNNDSLDEYKAIKDASSILLSRMKSNNAHVIITLGSRGVLLASKNEDPDFRHFPADTLLETAKSSNGAGDTLAGAFIHALLKGGTEMDAVRFGMEAALLSLDAEQAITPKLSALQYKQAT